MLQLSVSLWLLQRHSTDDLRNIVFETIEQQMNSENEIEGNKKTKVHN